VLTEQEASGPFAFFAVDWLLYAACDSNSPVLMAE